MKTICGIYRITNIRNKKSYIGQSRNISARWRQHTSNLSSNNNEALIRKAFVKYGLNTIVKSSGLYDGFLFEVLEECPPEMLFEKEYKWIDAEQPAYNIQRMPPNPDFIFQKKSTLSKRFWIQYHNVNKNGYYPGHIHGKNANQPLVNSSHYISTKKREAIKCLGDSVLMIAGIGKPGKTKNYFAWSVMVVEELEYLDDIDLSFNVSGTQQYFLEPVLLNEIEGFKEFQFRQGNFAFGFQNVATEIFFSKLQVIANGPFVTDEKLTWKKWVRDFEENYGYSFLRIRGEA